MKRNYLLYFLAIAALLVSSCKDSPDSLSSSKVKRLFNKQMKEQNLQQAFSTIDTGFYELNSLEARATLKRLEAAGLVTYSVERYAWWNKITDKKTTAHNVDYYYVYSGYYAYTKKEYSSKLVTSYELEEHFMVDVHLTDAGRKLAVDSIQALQQKEDKYLKQPEYRAADWPEDSKDVSENWPDIPYPVQDSSKVKAPNRNKTDRMVDTIIVNKTKSTNNANTFPKKESLDSLVLSRYMSAKERENHGDVIIKAFKVKVYKVRNIQIYQADGYTKGKAEVIVRTTEVTHAGHILNGGVINDMPTVKNVTLSYYQDKGWVIDDDVKDSDPDQSIHIEAPAVDEP